MEIFDFDNSNTCDNNRHTCKLHQWRDNRLSYTIRNNWYLDCIYKIEFHCPNCIENCHVPHQPILDTSLPWSIWVSTFSLCGGFKPNYLMGQYTDISRRAHWGNYNVGDFIQATIGSKRFLSHAVVIIDCLFIA